MIEGTLEAIEGRVLTVDGIKYRLRNEAQFATGTFPNVKTKLLSKRGDIKIGNVIALHGPPKDEEVHTVHLVAETSATEAEVEEAAHAVGEGRADETLSGDGSGGKVVPVATHHRRRR